MGFKFRKKTSELIEPVFGKKGTKVFFSGLLALGQIGWFAIINRIGGESLAVLIKSPPFIGILIYAYLMLVMASLKLYRFSLVKKFTTLSSIGLIVYLVAFTWHQFGLSQLKALTNKETIFWGTSIILASLISFSSVAPDFMYQLKSKSDLVLTIIGGLFIPGIIVCGLGAIIFSQVNSLSMEAIIGFSSLAFFGHFFNVMTNTDAAVALYTPGYRLSYMFNWRFGTSVLLAAIIGIVLSLLNINQFLELWLSLLAGIYHSIIGITLARYSLHYFGRQTDIRKRKTDWRAILIVAFCSLFVFIVNISLLHWLVGTTSFILYVLMTGVTIKIYMGKIE